MTPKEIQEALKRIAKPFGVGVYGSVSISTFLLDPNEEVGASISYKVGYETKAVSVRAPNFDAAITALDIAATNALRTLHTTIVRKLALAIIDATADAGSCNAASLRLAGFSSIEIERFSAAACVDANEIASNGPFQIVSGEPVLANGGEE